MGAWRRQRLTYPSTADTRAAAIGGFPFPFPAAGNLASGAIGYTGAAAIHTLLGSAGAPVFAIYAAGGAAVLNNAYSTRPFVFSFSYRTA